MPVLRGNIEAWARGMDPGPSPQYKPASLLPRSVNPYDTRSSPPSTMNPYSLPSSSQHSQRSKDAYPGRAQSHHPARPRRDSTTKRQQRELPPPIRRKKSVHFSTERDRKVFHSGSPPARVSESAKDKARRLRGEERYVPLKSSARFTGRLG